jgi:predicted amidophosphoribosyltransferase
LLYPYAPPSPSRALGQCCSKCGKAMALQSRFCDSCGTAVGPQLSA